MVIYTTNATTSLAHECNPSDPVQITTQAYSHRVFLQEDPRFRLTIHKSESGTTGRTGTSVCASLTDVQDRIGSESYLESADQNTKSWF